MRNAMHDLPPSIPFQYLTHSKNLDKIRALCPNQEVQADDSCPMEVVDHFYPSVVVRVNDLMPERSIEERWVPPTSGQFTQLGPEDECWARDLGLGTVERVDLGPLMYAFSDRIDRMLAAKIMIPEPVYGASILSSAVVHAADFRRFAPMW